MKFLLISAAVMGLFASAATAATLSYSATQSLQTTNYDDLVLSVAQFDPSLGTLNSVFVQLDGSVAGDAKGESLDAGPSSIVLKLVAQVSLATATLGDIVVTLPAADETFAASAFDGAIDFGGTSGVSLLGLSATDTNSATLTGAAMAEFIGLGNVSLLISALGQSNASGAGNIVTQFATQAGGAITVTYDYDPTVTPPAPVPLPAAMPMLVAGLGGLALLRRRNRG